MAYHIDLARLICQNALKIIVMLLFTSFYILAENFLHDISFRQLKERFLNYPFYRRHKCYFILYFLQPL